MNYKATFSWALNEGDSAVRCSRSMHYVAHLWEFKRELITVSDVYPARLDAQWHDGIPCLWQTSDGLGTLFRERASIEPAELANPPVDVMINLHSALRLLVICWDLLSILLLQAFKK